MPLQFAPMPQDGARLVNEAIARLSKRKSQLSTRGVDFTLLQPVHPHTIYDLDPKAITAGGGLSAARHTGYRYLVAARGVHHAAAEVHGGAGGAEAKVVNLNYGPYVEATAKALAAVQALAAVAAQDYEFRVLRSAPIYLMAVWLKSLSGGADIVYPLAPAPAGLQAEQAYSAQDFLNAVAPIAQELIAQGGPIMR